MLKKFIFFLAFAGLTAGCDGWDGEQRDFFDVSPNYLSFTASSSQPQVLQNSFTVISSTDWVLADIPEGFLFSTTKGGPGFTKVNVTLTGFDGDDPVTLRVLASNGGEKTVTLQFYPAPGADPDPAFFGVWEFYMGNFFFYTWSQVAISATELTFLDDLGWGYTIEITKWEAIENPSGDYVYSYPTGYKFTGILKNFTVIRPLRADGSGIESEIGDKVNDWWYISTDNSKLSWGSWFIPGDHEAAQEPFVRLLPC